MRWAIEEARRWGTHVPGAHAAHHIRRWHRWHVWGKHVRHRGVATRAACEAGRGKHRSPLVLWLLLSLLLLTRLALLLLMRRWWHLPATHPAGRHLIQPRWWRRTLEDLRGRVLSELSITSAVAVIDWESGRRWWAHCSLLRIAAVLRIIAVTLSLVWHHLLLRLLMLSRPHHG